MSACRALGSLTGLLDDAPALVKLAGQDDGHLGNLESLEGYAINERRQCHWAV